METTIDSLPVTIRPAPVFAFIKVLPLMLAAAGFLGLAYWSFALFIWPALAIAFFAAYRFLFIRATRYDFTDEVIRLRRGLFFKRLDTIELFRFKDYIQTQSLFLQIFGLMNLTIKTTDPENPVIWLRGIPFSNLIDDLRVHVLAARQHNQIVEIN